ncbi:AMP-dependent synthetase/ligase [Rhodoligotrophos defluvii]|uniref:AMP-dependent synthetase/ligase n=1 Tax=Rhodoligotrophos defluvii TaxID=2561934 RepID=UPI001961F1A4|nr:AMP-binding protein [Rhodoligotrophos defluvii]
MSGHPAWRGLDEMMAAGVATIPQALLYQAERQPDKVFHRRKDFGIWQPYRWKEVAERVAEIGMGLKALGVKRGQTVALVGENEPELFWSQYAANGIGAKVVCLFPDLTAAQMEFILDHSEAVTIICEDQEQVDKALELEPKLPHLGAIVYWDPKGMWKYSHPKLMRLDDVQARGREVLTADRTAFARAVKAGKGDDVAVLSYTSGTTGLPKACILTNSYLLDTPSRLLAAVEFKPHTQYLSYISPAWATEQIFGIALGVLVPLIVNFPEEPETVQENIREIGAEALMLAPRQWESLAKLVEAKMMDAGPIRRGIYRLGLAAGSQANLAKLEGRSVGPLSGILGKVADIAVLRHIRDNLGLQSAYLTISGGSGMAPEVFRLFHSFGVPLRNIYGSTEAGLLTVHQGEAYDLETVGKWLPVHPKFGPPISHKISDDNELLVRGGLGFQGYYNNPEASRSKLVDGWYRMGDAVHISDAGEPIFLDRLEDVRRLASGHSYPPSFIENRLRFSPFVKEVMTLGDETRPFVGALVNIDAVTVGKWAEQNRISFSTFADLSQNERVRALIAEEIRKVNGLLPKGSQVERFINFPKELDPDEDELTRTRKLRRKFLEEKYADFIEAIYRGASELTAEIPVRYQDGRTGVLKARVFANDVTAPQVQHKPVPQAAVSMVRAANG